MGRAADARASRGAHREPPAQAFRKNTGQHHGKIGRQERTQTHTRAVARKQNFPVKEVFVGFICFAAVCIALYFYLDLVLNDEEDDEVDEASK